MAENSGNKVFDWIKDHPWQTGVVIFVIGVAIVYMSSTNAPASANVSAGTTGSALNAAEIQAAMQQQISTQQANVQNNAIQASAGVQNNQTAASVSIATLQSQTQQNNNSLSAQTAQIIAGLQASVANTSTAAQVAINQNNDAALTAVALAPYQVEMAQINAQAAGTPAQIKALSDQVAQLAGATQASVNDLWAWAGYNTVQNTNLSSTLNAPTTTLGQIAGQYGQNGSQVARA